MSNPILIIGESGTGKSTSLRNLNPEETFIIQVIGKPLPFRGWRKKYTQYHREHNPEGNLFVTDKVNEVIALFKHISDNMPHIKNLIVDDLTYIMSNQFMKRATEKGFEKYNIIGASFFNVLENLGFYRTDLNIVMFGHSEQKDDGKTGIKTAGKLLDNQYSIAGLFTIVFETHVEKGEFSFITRNNGQNCAKSPMEMFDTYLIANDLQLVFDKIREYEEGE